MTLRLCAVDDIPPEGASGVTLPQTRLLVVRNRDAVHVYLNRCPHLGVPLQWQDSHFLAEDGVLLRCAMHGALFEKHTGLCLRGPCTGESLWRIDCRVEDGAVWVEEAELPPPRL
jgi:nitrite reductase/ring-hydroxylating ferredoxin subunit